MKEISRCYRFGYIETRSPLVEITKGVDSPVFSHLYCGYLHHRYIVWSNNEKGENHFLPKYGSFIDQLINIPSPTKIEILKNPFYWNNYFLWTEKPPKVHMYKVIHMKDFLHDYAELLNEAVNQSIRNTDYFRTPQHIQF